MNKERSKFNEKIDVKHQEEIVKKTNDTELVSKKSNEIVSPKNESDKCLRCGRAFSSSQGQCTEPKWATCVYTLNG